MIKRLSKIVYYIVVGSLCDNNIILKLTIHTIFIN